MAGLAKLCGKRRAFGKFADEGGAGLELEGVLCVARVEAHHAAGRQVRRRRTFGHDGRL